jgi:hypothetical protein
MALSKVCMLDPTHDRIDLGRLNCGNQSHTHLSRAQANELVRKGAVEWIKEPVNRGDKGIVRVLKRNYAIRGLSSKVGDVLAVALHVDKDIKKEREPWAEIMLSDIRRRVEAPEEEPDYVQPAYLCRPGASAPLQSASA